MDDNNKKPDIQKEGGESEKQKPSFIHAACTPSDKAKWVKKAQSNGMNLTDWIVETLNGAT